MRKNIVLFIFFLQAGFLFAQSGLKIAYIDMDYILENVPEYQEANNQLDAKVQKWRAEVEQKLNQVEQMKQALKQESPLLTKELIEEREDEIDYEVQQVVAYQQKRFGPQGDFITQKRQLIQPVQDQVFNAVQEYAIKRDFDYIFERSSDALMLFSADRHDISDQILKMIDRQSRTERRENKGADIAEDTYKSVEKAKEDKAEEAQRERDRLTREKERENLIKDRERARDSARAARQAAFEARRQKLLEDRQRRRDSLDRVRNNKE
ncbi:OmpH family outer membrane protein [Mesonia sediminis]|uniref:OmpH family outer membrane protein n=1 Tax=Mesonia sediminis TaxID=1703946 RepID=A0ABW5SAQ3_9FLAO